MKFPSICKHPNQKTIEFILAKLIALCYQFNMEQAIIRKLKDGTLAPYRALAKKNGRSLEAELRDLIERNRPSNQKSPEELRELSERACRLTVGGLSSDSTPYIRWVRDTDGGRSEGFPTDEGR